ncbi:hypothetical protein [Stappia sp.]|uniref:hypothetical protein n=1 Tax=Stappia sp. TaxID=1870903 RepID=UPI003A9A6323
MGVLMRFLRAGLAAVSVFALTGQVQARDQFSVFQEQWRAYVAQCSRVFAGGDDHLSDDFDPRPVRRKISADGAAMAMSAGSAPDYLSVYIDTLPDRELRSCAVYFEKYGAFDAATLTPKVLAWLDEQGLSAAGGAVPLDDASHHQLGVHGAFPGQDLTIRVRIFDWGFQLLGQHTILRK